MNLEDELTELLAGLGVVMEHGPTVGASLAPDPDDDPRVESDDMSEDDLPAGEAAQPSELCLFQTSREHYGVFYRLDLIEGAPQLRIFLPDECGAMKMRCYLVRGAAGSPLRAWFGATHAHNGSPAFDDARDTAQQHLLFAAGEVMKRLFWASELETACFPAEIEVRRLA
jgi:hypothetical protein